MKTKEQIKQLILENCVDKDGNIDLSHLDFSNFDGDINISFMTVKKTYDNVIKKLKETYTKIIKKLDVIYINIIKKLKVI